MLDYFHEYVCVYVWVYLFIFPNLLGKHIANNSISVLYSCSQVMLNEIEKLHILISSNTSVFHYLFSCCSDSSLPFLVKVLGRESDMIESVLVGNWYVHCWYWCSWLLKWRDRQVVRLQTNVSSKAAWLQAGEEPSAFNNITELLLLALIWAQVKPAKLCSGGLM